MAGGVKKIEQASEVVNDMQKFKSLGAIKNFWEGTKTGSVLSSIGKSINPLEHTYEMAKDVIKGTNELKFMTEAGTINKFAQYSKNFGEFAKDVVMTKAAVSEAQLEGGGVKIDVTNDLIKEFKNTHDGMDPEGEDLLKITNIAESEARRTAFWNLPAIMWSNKFMYETMFAPFEKTAKKGIENIADDILFDKTGFKAAKGIEGFLGKGKQFIKSPKAWGEFGYNYLKQNAAEGVQENLQEAISTGAKANAIDTYTHPNRKNYDLYMGHFIDGMKQQFSAQGFETFAGGFVMGAMAHPFMGSATFLGKQAWNNTVDRNNYTKYKEERSKQLDSTVNTLNEIYNDPLQYLAPDIVNAVKQGSLQKDFYQANFDNNRKKTEDIKLTSSFEHLFTAISTGKLDLILEKANILKDLSPEEAAKAFTPKIDGAKEFTPEEGAKALSMLGDMITRAKSIQENYDDVSSNYPNPYFPKRYKKNTADYNAEVMGYAAWEEAKKNLIYARTTYKEHSERIEKLASTLISKRNPIKDVNAQDLLVLLDNEQLTNQVIALAKEISSMDSSTAEGKKIIKEKTKRKELLEELGSRFESLKNFRETPKLALEALKKSDSRDIKAERKQLRKTFNNYVNHIAGTKGNMIFDNEVEHALNLIQDNYTLRDERASLVKSINVLNNPKGFLNLHRNLASAFKEIIDNKKTVVDAGIAQAANHEQLNLGLNQLTQKAGVYLTPAYIKYVLDTLNAKKEISLTNVVYIDATTGDYSEVGPGHPKFAKAQLEWSKIITALEADQVIEVKPKEEEKKEIKKEEPVSKVITPDMEYLHPNYDSLRAQIDPILEETFKLSNVKDEQKVAATAILLKSNPAILSIIKKYNSDITKTNAPVIEDEALATAPSIVAITPAQTATLEKLKPILEKVLQEKTDNGYKINNTVFNNRVTRVAREILQKLISPADFKWFEEYSKTEEGSAILDKIKPMFDAKNVTVDKIFKAIKAEPTINKILGKYYTDKTIEDFKTELNKDLTYDNFVNLLDRFKNVKATTRGNIVDDLVRKYFKDEKIIKPANINQAAFNNLIKILNNIRQTLNDKGEIIITDKLILSGEFAGKKIAGEMDIVVITPDGTLKIYDTKTASEYNWEKYNKDKVKKLNHSLQLSLYKNMIEAETGIPVTDIEILPIATEEDKDGNVTAIKQEKLGKIIYATLGSGKSTAVLNAKRKGELVDADELLVTQIKKQFKEIFNKDYVIPAGETPGQTILEFMKSSVSREEKNKLYKVVLSQINDLVDEGKTVLTGSTSYMQYADIVYIQQDDSKNRLSGTQLEDFKNKENLALEKSGKVPRPLNGYITNKIGFLDTISIPLEYQPAVEEYVPKVTTNKPEGKATEEGGIRTGTYPSETVIKKGIKLGFTKENIVDMSSEEREEIKKANTVDDVQDLLTKYVKPETTKEYTTKNSKFKVGDKTVNGQIVIINEYPTEIYAAYTLNNKHYFGNYKDLNFSISSSSISLEDAILKGILNLKESRSLDFNLKTINTIKDFNRYDELFKRISIMFGTSTAENIEKISDAFSRKEEELMSIISYDNLQQAKERNYNIILNSPLDYGLESSFISNFTPNTNGTVKIASPLGSKEYTIKMSEIKTITPMEAPESLVISEEAKKAAIKASEINKEVITDDEYEKANEEAKKKTFQEIKDELAKKLKC